MFYPVTLFDAIQNTIEMSKPTFGRTVKAYSSRTTKLASNNVETFSQLLNNDNSIFMDVVLQEESDSSE